MMSTLIPTLTLLVSQAAASMTSIAVTIPQWSMHEITLTASGQYASPSVSVDLVGVFRGPDAESVVVKGFWDGGRTFRIRFTLTRTGAWTFTTISDDPGLDGETGTITCVFPEGRSHGFVRQRGKMPNDRIYDDGSAVSVDARTISARGSQTSCGTDGSPCAGSIDPRLDVNLAALHSVDRLVASASAAGRLIQIALFDTSDANTIDQPRMYRDIEYITARYAAAPNVIWCMQAGSASDGAHAFWGTARPAVMTLDPYFTGPSGERVVRSQCVVAPSANGVTARDR